MAEYFATKYDSARDEVIALLADELEGFGRRDDTSGEVEAPTGWFALVTIPDDVDLTADYLGGDYLEELTNTYGVRPADVAGVHIVTENSQGFVDVTSFDSEAEAREVFDALCAEYSEWLGDENE